MAKATGDIRIVKKKNVHGGHHGGAWKVAYADFMTAMMAFFLVMWIVGLSQSIRQSVAGYFDDPQGFMQAVKGGNAPFQVAVPGSGAQGGNKPTQKEVEQAIEREKLKAAKSAIEKVMSGMPEFRNLKQHVDISLVNDGMRIDLIEDQKNLFFDAASAVIKPGTKKLLTSIAYELEKLPNKIVIEGHTDNRPLNRTDGYTNWELSADRANAARQVMERKLTVHQISQVRGYADTQPRDPKHPEHFSNRRVSIIVLMKNTDPEAHATVGNAEESSGKSGDDDNSIIVTPDT